MTATRIFLSPKLTRLLMMAIAFFVLQAAGVAAAQTCSSMSLGNTASLNGFIPFPANNVWNTNIASAPLDPNSDLITSASGFAGLHLHPDFGSESDFGFPYVIVDSTITPSVSINVIDSASESDIVVAPFPLNAPIEGNPADCSGWPDTYNGDAHVLVLDRAKCFLYETFNTNRCNGLYDASSETIWDMNNYETRPWGWTSADAAGLPIFPGLVRYDEIASGAINHALRFTLEQTKNDNNSGYFVYPASHAAGNNWGTNNVMGMRIRLKADFDISGFSPVNQIILTAMKQYGMILADNGGYFYFQGISDPRWSDSDLDNLKNVASSNFEVVQATPEFPGYDAVTAPTGDLPVINTFTVSASNVNPRTPVTFSYNVTGDSYDFIDTIGPIAAGSGSLTITPTSTQTYTLNSTNAYGRTISTPLTVTVNKTTPSITWPAPASISYGTPLSAAQLNATSTVAGSFAYSPSAGTVPNAGFNTVSVTFTPTDGIDYNTASGSVNLTVSRAPLTVSANNISKIVGTANPAFSASYSGFVNGENSNFLAGAPAFTTTATVTSPIGTYPITVTPGTLTAANYALSFVPGTLYVVAAPTIVLSTSATLSGSAATGYTASVTVTNSGTGAALNVTLTGAALGSATGITLPLALGTIAAGGGSASATVNFPASAGADGTTVVEKISGSYTGGTFSTSIRAKLP
ncbi:MAG: MBG domain-containing protein [Terracidiphilus sp.]